MPERIRTVYSCDMITRLLMCRPDHFGVTYDINPWMTQHVGSSAPDAVRQWERFVEVLQIAGDVSIETIEPVAGLPDLVFTANAALISGNLAICASFRHPERRREQSLYRSWLASRGFATTFLQQTFFEGSGDALFDRTRPQMFAGYGWRTERSATLQLSETISTRVVPLLLVDERFYHLDVALNPLASGHVMVYMNAFSPHAQVLLRRAVEPEFLIELTTDDALAFAANSVEIGDAMIMHSCSKALQSRLYDAGYRVFTTDLSEFHKAGGSAKCLTLKLNDGPAANAVAA